MNENKSEVARIREQIDAERAAAERGLFGLAYGVSRHDFITRRMEAVADEAFRRREQHGDQEALTYMTTAMDALYAEVVSEALVSQTSAPPGQQGEQHVGYDYPYRHDTRKGAH
ncbi:MAG: hypothetical protein JO125_03465 [Chloroflexi bacterium]|nr:hypothetical protein [Ktedonobacteraceae bacterium]MBV9706449.1 hypothetical protein [Chloroflexota bacterium]